MNVAAAPKFTAGDAERLARELCGASIAIGFLPNESERTAPVEVVFP
jgi:hypothetical protein